MVTKVFTTAVEAGSRLVYPDLINDVVKKMVDTAARMGKLTRDSFSGHALVPRGAVMHEADLLSLFAHKAREWGLLPEETQTPQLVEFPVRFDLMKMEMTVRISTALPADLQTLKQEVFRVFWSRFHKEFHSSEEPTAEGLLLRGRAVHFIMHLREAHADRVDPVSKDARLKFKKHLPGGRTELIEIHNEEELRKYLLSSTGSEEISPLSSGGMQYDFEWFRKMFQTTVKMHGTAERVILRYNGEVVDTNAKLLACLARHLALDKPHISSTGFDSIFSGGHTLSSSQLTVIS